MREVFLIGCHITNELQLSYLSELVHKLKSAQKDYIIVSHTQIPEFLTKDSKAYLYDSDNHIIPNHELGVKNLFWFANDSFRIKSTTLGYGSHNNYSIAVLNLFFRGVLLAKSMDYQLLHWVEYDFNIDLPESYSNCGILNSSKFDMVAYKTNYNLEFDGFINGAVVNHIFGSFFTINIQSFNDKYFWIKKNILIEELKRFNFNTELFTQESIVESSKIYFKDLSNYEFTNRESVVSKLQFAIFEDDGYLKLFLLNSSTDLLVIHVFASGYESEFKMTSNLWIIDKICPIGFSNFIEFKSDYLNLKIDLSDEKKYDFYVRSTVFEIQ